MNRLISVVAPMYNEEALVDAYCKEVLAVAKTLSAKYDFEIILVNDGSKDRTYELMLEEQKKHPAEITVVCLSRNFGLEGAVNAGVTKAQGDAVIVMDADLQDPPSLLPEMIEKWEAGADIVVGSRIKRSNDSLFKKAGAGLYYKVLNSFSGKLKLEESAANFRLLSRKAVDQIKELPEVNGVFRVVVPYVGMKTDIVEYDRDKRYSGEKKYNLKSMIPYALDSITGISVSPLRKIMWFVPLGLMIMVGAVLGFLFSTAEWKPAWLVVIVLVFLFVLGMIALSVMAEYIAQILLESKGRPASIVYEYIPCENAKR